MTTNNFYTTNCSTTPSLNYLTTYLMNNSTGMEYIPFIFYFSISILAVTGISLISICCVCCYVHRIK